MELKPNLPPEAAKSFLEFAATPHGQRIKFEVLYDREEHNQLDRKDYAPLDEYDLVIRRLRAGEAEAAARFHIVEDWATPPYVIQGRGPAKLSKFTAEQRAALKEAVKKDLALKAAQ
jgi:hypothetical protein